MHWKHSRFQVVFTILGNCHTLDEGYRVLCELEEDRAFAISSALAESKRSQSKVIGSKLILQDGDETKANKMLAECFLDETSARKQIAQSCLDEARRELKFITALKTKLQPHRKYAHLPDHEAHQACQIEEYMCDLVWKAYNHLCSTGIIPYDHYMLIKMHPLCSLIMRQIRHMLNDMQQSPADFLMCSKEQIFAFCNDRDILLLDTSRFSISNFGEVEYDNQVSRLIGQSPSA